MGNILGDRFKVRLKSGEVVERNIHIYGNYSFILYNGSRIKVQRCLDTWYEVPWKSDYVFDRYLNADDMDEYRFLVECFIEKGYELDKRRMDLLKVCEYSDDIIVTEFYTERERVRITIPFRQWKGKYQTKWGEWHKR